MSVAFTRDLVFERTHRSQAQNLFNSISEPPINGVGRWDTYPKLVFINDTRHQNVTLLYQTACNLSEVGGLVSAA
jgi:hypothetical protein